MYSRSILFCFVPLFMWVAMSAEKSVNLPSLIPETPGKVVNYFCTWRSQEDRDDLNEHKLLGDNMLAERAYPSIRSELYIVLDDGWDLPAQTEHLKNIMDQMGSLKIYADRFPSFTGTPTENLKKLVRELKARGWGGVGLWIAANEAGTSLLDREALQAYWRERAIWCAEAGIGYWKVDWGKRSRDIVFRKLLSRLGNEHNILVEHAYIHAFFNDEPVPWHKNSYQSSRTGRYGNWDNGKIVNTIVDMMSFGDVHRSYDVFEPLSIATTVDRIAAILTPASQRQDTRALLNVENEVYLGAGLACMIGIMRSPMNRSNHSLSIHRGHHCLDEAVRAVRWQRLAPPLPAQALPIQTSTDILEDWYYFSEYEPGITWHRGEKVYQRAPAVLARGIALPEVQSRGLKPYVVASKHANGAIAIATARRTRDGLLYVLPQADVTLKIGSTKHPIGIFGRYKSLTLVADIDLTDHRVYAQDILAIEAIDITDQVTIHQNELRFSGALIEKIGLSAATPDDLSDPGMALQLTGPMRDK